MLSRSTLFDDWNMNTDTTFVIADNQDITRAGLHHYIGSLAGVGKVLDVCTKKELVATLMNDENSVVVLDYTLFDLNGAEELLILGNRFPRVRWLLFSHELSESLIRRLGAEYGISMILKENSGGEIKTALQCALKGERFLCHQIANLLLTRVKKPEAPSGLTPTEVEILKLIARGKSVKEIAAERHSSIHTIVTHKKNIFRKIEVNNIYEATKYALRAGMIEMVEYYI